MSAASRARKAEEELMRKAMQAYREKVAKRWAKPITSTDDREGSTSVHTTSGGLPTLGKGHR